MQGILDKAIEIPPARHMPQARWCIRTPDDPPLSTWTQCFQVLTQPRPSDTIIEVHISRLPGGIPPLSMRLDTTLPG